MSRSVLVKIDRLAGQRRGDWVVTLAGRSRPISRHRTKKAAVKRARREARKRGTDLRIQNRGGRWRQGPGY